VSLRDLAIESLTARGFRNLASAEIQLGPRFNVVSGDNGQGKTNLLEAIYLVATSRSFRTSKPLEMRAHDQEACSVRARIREAGQAREQVVGLRRGVREVRVDARRSPTLAEYAVRTPVVVFHPGSMQLSMGSGSERRRLMDRLALYQSPASLGDLDAYTKAMRGRQRVLEARGESSRDLDPWEELVVRHGMAVTAARDAAVASLAPAATRAFATIGAEGLELHVSYQRGAPATEDAFLRALSANRARDRARGSATVGPHRDDVLLQLDGRAARGIASQGQHRATVLSLELAELELIGAARGVQPILLLDDVSSELDRSRTLALTKALGTQTGQVVLTTTRPELIETLEGFETGSRRDFHVVGGTITPR
jgi:DNA replication and repair protein RecF